MKKRKRGLKKLDIILLILFPILSVFISLLINSNYLISILLFFGMPAVYLSIRNPGYIQRSLLFSLLFSVPFSIVVNEIAVFNKAWATTTIFSSKFLGITSYEDLLFGFLFVYASIMFYNHLISKGKHNLINDKMRYFIIPSIIIIISFLIIYSENKDVLRIPYAYLILGLIFGLMPLITYLSFFPKKTSKYMKTGSYFFLNMLLFEITALQLNQWSFPGNEFLGWINIFGNKFPIEEFILFIIIAAMSVVMYYEFFDQDK